MSRQRRLTPQKFYNNPRYSDVNIIIAGDIKIYAHQIILRQYSPVITAMLDTPMTEGLTSTIDFRVHDPTAVTYVINHMYEIPDTHTSEHVDGSNVVNFALFLMMPVHNIRSLMRHLIIADVPRLTATIACVYNDRWSWDDVFMFAINNLYDPNELNVDEFQRFYDVILHKQLRGVWPSRTARIIFTYADNHPEFNIIDRLEDFPFHDLPKRKLEKLMDLNVVRKNNLLRSYLQTRG